MKSTFLKTMVLTASMLATIGHAGSASAHTQAGSLGRQAEATDLYVISCSDDGSGPPARLETQIFNVSRKNVLISVQTIKGNQATNSTDLRGGDVRSSPAASNSGGAGAYYVAVNKAKKGLATYNLRFHCITSTNVETGTDILTLQNQ